MLEQQKLSVNGKDVAIRADRELFARLLIIREKRGISIKELLKYSLAPIAWSLATPQANIFKYSLAPIAWSLATPQANIFKYSLAPIAWSLATPQANIFKYSLAPIAWSLATPQANIFKYSLAPIAWSLATSQRNIFKSVKSKLLKALEEKITFVDHVPQESARFYDGICIVQQVPTGFEVFGQLSDYILKRITSNPSTNIFFTTDQ